MSDDVPVVLIGSLVMWQRDRSFGIIYAGEESGTYRIFWDDGTSSLDLELTRIKENFDHSDIKVIAR